METTESNSCFNCIHLHVCELNRTTFDLLPKFCDFDKPGGAEWLTGLYSLIAQRCKHYYSRMEIEQLK